MSNCVISDIINCYGENHRNRRYNQSSILNMLGLKYSLSILQIMWFGYMSDVHGNASTMDLNLATRYLKM